MKRPEKSVSKPRLQSVDPSKIKIPKVRITSTWPPELLEMLKSSIEADGIQQPILLAKDKEALWLIDGLHRLDEAKLQGMKKVPCVVITASMKDVLLKNLYMNRLRGGVKASEMVRVIMNLRSEHAMTSEDVAKETGLRRDYIEKILQTSKAAPAVLEALDREEIGVGHAYEISRVDNRDVQLRLLSQVFAYRLTVKDLHNIVQDTLEILKKRAELKVEKGPVAPAPVPTVRCHMCEQDFPPRKVVGVNICMDCYGIAHEAIRIKMKPNKNSRAAEIAEEVTHPRPHETLTTDLSHDQQNLKPKPLEPIDYGVELPIRKNEESEEKSRDGKLSPVEGEGALENRKNDKKEKLPGSE